MKEQSTSAKATHEEICDGALRHYRKISLVACEWMNTVEKAIIFYRNNYRLGVDLWEDDFNKYFVNEEEIYEHPDDMGPIDFKEIWNVNATPPEVKQYINDLLASKKK